jgi:hypothetical protein
MHDYNSSVFYQFKRPVLAFEEDGRVSWSSRHRRRKRNKEEERRTKEEEIRKKEAQRGLYYYSRN